MGGKSSSQANQSTTNNNIDERVVNESGVVVGKSANVGNINIERVDADIVENAINQFGEGFGKLLDISDKMFNSGAQMIQSGQDTVLSAMQSAENDKRGAIDQKTMIVLAITGAAAVAFIKGKK